MHKRQAAWICLVAVFALGSAQLCVGAERFATRSEHTDRQPRTPLTLEDLESLALANNPTLVQAHAQLEGARAAALQAGLYHNPILGYVGEQMGVRGTAGETQGGFVQQRIDTAGKLKLSRAKYQARSDVTESLALVQQYRVLNDVRIHYYQTLGAEQLVNIHRQLLKSAEDNLVTTREMLNVGQANQADLHLAKAELEQQRLDLMMAENDYQLAWQRLTAIVGLQNQPPAPLAGPLDGETLPINWETAVARLVAESPELAAAQTKVGEDQITVQRERVQPIPDIFVAGLVGKNFESGDTTASATAFIEIPLFDRNQGTIRQAEADLARSRGEVRRLELILRRRLAEQYRRYQTASQHVRAYQEAILPETRAAYRARLQAYQEGRETWPNVLAVQRNYFLLQSNYVKNLVAWREAEVAINGFLLVDGLASPLEPVPPGHIDAVPKPR